MHQLKNKKVNPPRNIHKQNRVCCQYLSLMMIIIIIMKVIVMMINITVIANCEMVDMFVCIGCDNFLAVYNKR